jgi:hypothetical protein
MLYIHVVRTTRGGGGGIKNEKMGYIRRYDTYYSDVTGEWLEKIGFCDLGTCEFCDKFDLDGRPENAFVAIENIAGGTLDEIPW